MPWGRNSTKSVQPACNRHLSEMASAPKQMELEENMFLNDGCPKWDDVGG